jgi:quercetin dioxygenase-like cupin family protein
MKRGIGIVALGVLAIMFAIPALTAAQEHVEARFDRTVPVDAPYEAHQLVLDFVPGTVAPLHRHGGPGYITMLQGELTLQTDGDEQVYAEGDSFIEVPESLYEGWNDTDQIASLIVTYIVPEGHDVTRFVDSDSSRSGPAPQPVTQALFPVEDPIDDYQVVHMMLNLEPDEWVSIHDERGRSFITVVDGVMTAEGTDGSMATLQQGDTLSEGEGPGHRLGNTGSEPVTVAVTLLVPDGADGTWTRPRQIGALVAAGAFGMAGGAYMLRRRNQAA